MSAPLSESASEPRPSQLHLARDLPLSKALQGAFANILAYACQQRERVEEDAVKAVHEYRKSIRRARAMVRLLRGPDWRAIDVALRDAVRATSILRDRDVLLDILSELPPEGDREALRSVIEQHREQSDPAAVLADGVARLEPLPQRWGETCPGRLKRKELRGCVADSFRRALDARARAAASRQDEDVHRWRKRAKELRYQLELLGAKQPGASRSLHQSLVEQVTRLGEITDDAVMHAYVRAHCQAIGPSAEELLAALRRRIEARVAHLLLATLVEYDTRPKVFARQALANLD